MRVIENGDIFTDDADVLVCPVNTFGVLGKGLALEFKQRFPSECRWYQRMCSSGHFRPGEFHSYGRIGFAATKNDWRNPSQIIWIERICETIKDWQYEGKLNSVAIPALGCGLGELTWADVLSIMQRHFADIDARVYAPLEGTR